jgi:hypothetical protein
LAQSNITLSQNLPIHERRVTFSQIPQVKRTMLRVKKDFDMQSRHSWVLQNNIALS